MHTRLLAVAWVLCATPVAAQPLPRATPESQGVPSAAVLALVQAMDTSIDAMHGIVIVRHGRVVAEGWWKPYDAATPHMLYSLSKSFTSTAVGLAVSEGKLGLDDPVLKFFPDQAPANPSANLRAMRVRDLLRMTTGHVAEPPILDGRHVHWVHDFLADSVPYKPGTHFLYNTPATYMLSAIVQKVTGQRVRDYLQPRLFTPLGFGTPEWADSPEGISLGGFGLDVRTEDIARFGLLLLNRGRWNGKQLVPAKWVEEATSRQTSNGSSPNSDWDQGYAYQFWRSRHGFRGDGAFGQYMLVLPEEDLVVAINSGVLDMQPTMQLVWDKLLPALSRTPLPADPMTRRALQTKLGALGLRTVAGRATSPLASRVSGKWYDVAANDRGVRAIALDFGATPTLRVRTAAGETATPIGAGAWPAAAAGFTNGIDRIYSAPAKVLVSATGAWTADSVFTVKLATPATPYTSMLAFTFDGDKLIVDSEYNVSFGGPTKLPRLEGKLASP